MTKRKGDDAQASGGGGHSRTIERRRERLRRQRRRQQLTIAASILVIALIALVLVIIINRPVNVPIPEGTNQRYTNIQQFTTTRGYARLGETDRTVRVSMYSSFACAECATFHREVYPELLQRVENLEINLVFVPLRDGTVPNGEGAAKSAICAGEQDAFWQYHDALFSWQDEFGNQAFPSSRLSGGFESLGLNLSLYNSCIRGNQVEQVMESARQETNQLIDDGSDIELPYITVNGVLLEGETETGIPTTEQINAAIDEALLLRGITPGDQRNLSPEVTEEPQPPTATPSNTPTHTPTATPTATATATATETSTEPPPEVTEEAGS